MPFAELLSVEARRLTRGCTVVAITPAVLQAWVDVALLLERSGYSVVTVLVDPASFGGQFGASVFHGRLLAARMPAILLRKGDSLKEALNALPPVRRLPVLPLVYAGPRLSG